MCSISLRTVPWGNPDKVRCHSTFNKEEVLYIHKKINKIRKPFTFHYKRSHTGT